MSNAKKHGLWERDDESVVDEGFRYGSNSDWETRFYEVLQLIEIRAIGIGLDVQLEVGSDTPYSKGYNKAIDDILVILEEYKEKGEYVRKTRNDR